MVAVCQCLLRKHKACSLPFSSCGRKVLEIPLGLGWKELTSKAECCTWLPLLLKAHHSAVVSCTRGRMPWAGRKDRLKVSHLGPCWNIIVHCFVATYMEVPCLLIPLCLNFKMTRTVSNNGKNQNSLGNQFLRTVCIGTKNALEVLVMCKLKKIKASFWVRRHFRSMSNHVHQEVGTQRNGPLGGRKRANETQTEQESTEVKSVFSVVSTSKFTLSRKSFCKWSSPTYNIWVGKWCSDLSLNQGAQAQIAVPSSQAFWFSKSWVGPEKRFNHYFLLEYSCFTTLR